MVLRRLLVVGALALMVVLSTGATTAPDTADSGHGEPCVAQIECAGGLAAMTGALLLVVAPKVTAGFFSPTPARRVLALPTAAHPALLASRLFRPPRDA